MEDTLVTVPGSVHTPISAPYWESLAQGSLTFQRCKACHHAWLPARRECPHCLADDWGREAASGSAKLISWVVYHVAYHPSYANRLPYNVAVVELAEGPRMISNVIGVEDAETLKIDQPLSLVIQLEGNVSVARFQVA